MSQFFEEATNKRKLLYDGHGTGEDKRLVSIIKGITKFCLFSDPAEDTVKISNIISKDISAAIHSAEKHITLMQLCDNTIAKLEEAIEEKFRDVKTIQNGLVFLELDLQYAEKLRKVCANPDCVTTSEKMRLIELKKNDLMEQLEKQRDNMRTLMDACKKLATLIDINDTKMDVDGT